MTTSIRTTRADARRFARTLARANEPMRQHATEHAEQCAVIDWRDANKAQYQGLALLHAIPNGGKRNIIVALKLKTEGVTPGIPDLHLPVARGGYHSLYVEMKSEHGRLSDKQIKIIAALEAEGNRVEVAYNADDAIEAIQSYLNGEVVECLMEETR